MRGDRIQGMKLAGVTVMIHSTGAIRLAALVLALAASGGTAVAQDAEATERKTPGFVRFAAAAQAGGALTDQAMAGDATSVMVERPTGRLVIGADKVQGRAIYGNSVSTEAGGSFLGGAPRGLPLARASLTSRFGYRQHPVHGGTRMHSGVDLAAPMGTPVRATADGVVAGAGWRGGYGIMVSLGHGGGMSTRYAHLSAIAVQPGTAVKAGQVIGYVGATGTATGPHVHYEVRMNGRAVNPMGS